MSIAMSWWRWRVRTYTKLNLSLDDLFSQAWLWWKLKAAVVNCVFCTLDGNLEKEVP